jgi:predicted nucleotidyltransferase component of viral defense system
MEYSIEEWVEEATQDRTTFRQAVHTILLAISNSDYLRPKMVMKGGMLLGIRYKSSRFTEDIDFSTSLKLSDINIDAFRAELDQSLISSSSELSYRVDCKVQSLKVQPKDGNATYPSFNLKIGYASKDNAGGIKRLNAGHSANTVKIDYSFNEETLNVDEVRLEDEESVFAYSLNDVIAEKYRSIIQQVIRNRSRRQDVYDLNYLLETVSTLSTEEKMDILLTLISKSQGRLPSDAVTISSLDNPETIAKSRQDYELLAVEIDGALPPFDLAYGNVNEFYKSLPWDFIGQEL